MILSYTNYKKENTPLFINKDLLSKYKEKGDICLVNIKRELTRSLVDYKLFQKLQQVNNDFFVIVDYLDSEHYTNLKEIIDDRTKLLNDINVFTRHCKSNVSPDIYENIFEDCNKLMITIHKLVEIVKTINKGDY